MLNRSCLFLSLLFLVACGDDDGGYAYPPSYADAGAPPSSQDAGAPAVDAGPPSQDRFDEVGTNPFTVTAHDPFSTFAADVDTASYDIFVRDIEDGLLPDRRSVRLEEYVNYFDYDYTTPETEADVPFAIDLEASSHAMGRNLAQLRVGIQAAAPAEFVKLPTNLVFLVDSSGSMSDPDKLPLVKRLIEESLLVLDPNDTVSIVTYAGDTSVRLSGVPALDRDAIRRALRGIDAGGGTAGGAGIQMAYQEAERHFVEEGFNHVVLCTDGDFNIGISNADDLVALIEEKRESGVTLTAVGFGRGNLNDAMMERVSNAGNGIYSVLSSERQTELYAAERILHTAQHVAQDMKIQVEFNGELVQAYRLLGYENRAIADQDFRNDRVDAGEVGAGHRVTALYELVLADQTIPEIEGAPAVLDGAATEETREIATDELVRVKVRWKELGAGTEGAASEVVASLTREGLRPAESTSPDFQWAAAVAAFAEILKDSPYADLEDLGPIEDIVRSQAMRDRERGEFEAHLMRAIPMLTSR